MNLKEIAKNSALIVVDMQNDFCPGGRLAVKEGDMIVDIVNRCAPAFPYVVATKDWHPADHISFASNHAGKKPFDSVEVSGIRQTLWPDHCVRGTEGAELHPRFDLRPISLVLHKGMRRELDSYSAFFENDRETPTGLEFLLRGLGFGRVFLCGLATDVCVFYSAGDSVRLGFETFLIEDACRGVDVPEGSVQDALKKLMSLGVRIAAHREIVP
jgi:nicotinamidase/pyrazinamidase